MRWPSSVHRVHMSRAPTDSSVVCGCSVCTMVRYRYAIDDAMLEMSEAVLDTIIRIASEVKYGSVVIFENCHILKVHYCFLCARPLVVVSVHGAVVVLLCTRWHSFHSPFFSSGIHTRVHALLYTVLNSLFIFGQDRLSTLKIECLKSFRDNVNAKYKAALDDFVQSILGRPMEKLSTFFEKVERLIDSGTAAKEVGFQMAFSKSELRKVSGGARLPTSLLMSST